MFDRCLGENMRLLAVNNVVSDCISLEVNVLFGLNRCILYNSLILCLHVSTTEDRVSVSGLLGLY